METLFQNAETGNVSKQNKTSRKTELANNMRECERPSGMTTGLSGMSCKRYGGLEGKGEGTGDQDESVFGCHNVTCNGLA